MRTPLRNLLCLVLAGALAGCGLVYKPTVQQGNFLKQKDVKQLKPGLTKRQVLVLLGTPSVASPFDHDRWDYVSTYTPRSGKTTLHALTLYFDNDVLTRTEGDFFNENPNALLKQAKQYKTNYDVNDTSGDKGGASKSDTPVLGPDAGKPATPAPSSSGDNAGDNSGGSNSGGN